MKDRSRKTREQLKKDAQNRQADRDKRTPTQQLTRLDALLGKNVGAVRERARLQNQIADAQGQRITKPENVITVPEKG